MSIASNQLRQRLLIALNCSSWSFSKPFRNNSLLNQNHLDAATLIRCRLFKLQQRFCSNIPGMTRKRKEKDYERLVEDDKPYKKVLALKEILLKEPEQVISLGNLGMLRRQVGLKGDRRFVTLLRKYPAIFELYMDEEKQIWCGFAPQAEELAQKELQMRKAYESVAVEKLRKLLMMSINRRLHIPKIAHLRRDLGFPDDFQKRMVYAYPEYFRVLEDKDGPLLELTSWDPALAVTALEKRAKETGDLNSEGELRFKQCVSKALTLSMKQKAGLEKFQERPFISPYADSRDFEKSTMEFQKRQIALIHEILSMTLEKKTIIDYLTHFRKEYRLPKSVLMLVLRHHAIFYVSRKGGRFTVFLKEAYEKCGLIEKDEWTIYKEKFIALMALGRKVKKVEDVDGGKDIEDDGKKVEDSVADADTNDDDAVTEEDSSLEGEALEEATDGADKVTVDDDENEVSSVTSDGEQTEIAEHPPSDHEIVEEGNHEAGKDMLGNNQADEQRLMECGKVPFTSNMIRDMNGFGVMETQEKWKQV